MSKGKIEKGMDRDDEGKDRIISASLPMDRRTSKHHCQRSPRQVWIYGMAKAIDEVCSKDSSEKAPGDDEYHDAGNGEGG